MPGGANSAAGPAANGTAGGSSSSAAPAASDAASPPMGDSNVFHSRKSEPGAFGVMRRPSEIGFATLTSVFQNALTIQVRERSEELLRVQREDEQRASLVVTLEQEVFEKERILTELRMQKRGALLPTGSTAEGVDLVAPDRSATIVRDRLQHELQLREGEAADVRQRVGALEELIREKRAEVAAKGEATLQLLRQLSCSSCQQRINGSPLKQADPSIPPLTAEPAAVNEAVQNELPRACPRVASTQDAAKAPETTLPPQGKTPQPEVSAKGFSEAAPERTGSGTLPVQTRRRSKSPPRSNNGWSTTPAKHAHESFDENMKASSRSDMSEDLHHGIWK